MRTLENPEGTYSDFLATIDDDNASAKLPKDVGPAMQQLFAAARRDVNLAEHSISKQIRRNTNVTVKKAHRNTAPWNIATFNQYARTCADPETMPWKQLKPLAVGIFSIYLPARFIALTRIDTSTEEWSKDSSGRQVVKVLSQEKTDYGKGMTELVFRDAEEQRLSPLYYYRILKARAERLGCPGVLFCSDKGQPYSGSDTLSKSLMDLLHDLGIDPDGEMNTTAYSIRTTMINSLFDAGLDVKAVNMYTGHSFNANTVCKHYYKLDVNWAGKKIREAPLDPKPSSKKQIKGVKESMKRRKKRMIIES
jgi:hypothetical protein